MDSCHGFLAGSPSLATAAGGGWFFPRRDHQHCDVERGGPRAGAAARYLGVADRVGPIEVRRQANLAVVRGNPAAAIRDIANVELVFKDGVGYDLAKLIESKEKGSSGISGEGRVAVLPVAPI